MKSMFTALKMVALSVVAFAGPVGASSIPVFNTGVNGTGVLLASGATDPHYTIVSGPNGAQAATAQLLAPGAWTPNTPTSQWIAPSSGQDNVGTFAYQTTFSLYGLMPSTAVLSGMETADNELTILLNGATVFTNSNATEWASFTPFTIDSGFVAGMNTLVFDVQNNNYVSGLQIQITGSAQPISSAVPEPNTLSLLLLCSALVIMRPVCRRFREVQR